MTGNRHNREGNSGEEGEPDPGPYWRRMHRDWRFWVGALFLVCSARHLRAERRPCMDTAQPTAIARASNDRALRLLSIDLDVGDA